MILKSRAFSLALLLAIAVMAPGILKAQDAQPMSETSLGASGGTTKTGGTSLDGFANGDLTGVPATGTAGPEAATFDGTYLWVATQFNDSVTRIRGSDGLIAGTFAVGKRPVALLAAAGSVWVANLLSDNVMKLNPSTGAVSATYVVGDGPGGLAFDGTNLWIANREGNSVTKLSPTGANLGTFAVGKRPMGVAVVGGAVFVVNN